MRKVYRADKVFAVHRSRMVNLSFEQITKTDRHRCHRDLFTNIRKGEILTVRIFGWIPLQLIPMYSSCTHFNLFDPLFHFHLKYQSFPIIGVLFAYHVQKTLDVCVYFCIYTCHLLCRSHLNDIRDRSVLRLFESAEGGPLPQGLTIAAPTWDQDQSYFSEPEFDSEYQHQHIHKTKVTLVIWHHLSYIRQLFLFLLTWFTTCVIFHFICGKIEFTDKLQKMYLFPF